VCRLVDDEELRSEGALERTYPKTIFGLELIRNSVWHYWEFRIDRGSSHKRQNWAHNENSFWQVDFSVVFIVSFLENIISETVMAVAVICRDTYNLVYV
jgi:hypothetical protein